MIWRRSERWRERGWSMRSGMTAAVVLAALVMVTAPTGAAYAASTPTGNDVSYPQCGQALPSGQARVSLYVNTANPGNHGVTDWPATNNNPLGGKLVSDPYGTCTGANNPACAWQYGWNLAELDAQTRGVPNPGRYRWWLDVETINSWESSTANNRADLEGMVSYLRRIRANVGIYSTPKQWDPIVGTVAVTSPLYHLPDWIPGATTLSRAKKNCRLAPLTGAGTVTVVQWSTKPVNRDLACRAPSPKRAGTR